MIKRAASPAIALLIPAAFNLAGAETPPQGILQCTGSQSAKGFNAPKDAVIPTTGNVSGTYTLNGNVLIESGGGGLHDHRYSLCSTTSTNYIYSTDCKVQPSQYFSDWLRVTDPDKNRQFETKYKDSTYMLATIIIDRVNLQVDEDELNTFLRTHDDKKSRSVTIRPASKNADRCVLEPSASIATSQPHPCKPVAKYPVPIWRRFAP
jgi:hypothetical protein